MHPLNEKFSKVYCINLINRSDRKEKMQKRFSELGIELEFYTTVELGFANNLLKLLRNTGHDFVYPGEISCCMAHYSIIKLAKEQKLKNVFIFEDDCVFHKNFNELLPQYLAKLPDDWNMFYLYTMMFNWPKDGYIYNENGSMNFFRPKGAHCASSYAVNSNFYDNIIESIDNDFRIIDSRYRLMMDDTNNKIYSVFPNLCGQDMDTSNIRGDGNTLMDYFSNIVTFGKNKKEDYR